MRILDTSIFALLICVGNFLYGQVPVSLASDCAHPTAQAELKINNVRAKLLIGGDLWWDGEDAGYQVPKVPDGEPGVSSLFAGALWVGGLDPGGNLKLAAQTYGSGSGSGDYTAGPLQGDGTTDSQSCENWDRFFRVTREEVDEHLFRIQGDASGQMDYTADQIPQGIKGWPAAGNPYFTDENGFSLPNSGQGLAPFWDDDSDGVYDPLEGDYPVVEIDGCGDPVIPDEHIFWIFNDNGNIHPTRTNALQFEFQASAFAYKSLDALNNSTFYRYKVINRAVESLEDIHLGLWVDADLGCFTDDLFGVDTTRSLAYYYNEDAVDGETGCDCPFGVNSYCGEVPAIGIDLLRGPQTLVPARDDTGQVIFDPVTGDTLFEPGRIGMSSFTYYFGGTSQPPPPLTTPQTAPEYYRFLRGQWRDGSPITMGGLGLNSGGRPTNFVFPSYPDCTDPDCWSMCSENLPRIDFRTVQSAGPFRLDPGGHTSLVYGVVWAPELDYPCPDMTPLLRADDHVQAVFDGCFQLIREGPDAPDLTLSNFDREIAIFLSNDPDRSNNYLESYYLIDPSAPPSLPAEDRTYSFEGYKVFQLSGPNVRQEDLDDPMKARLIFQTDIPNGIGRIYNWNALSDPINPGAPPIWVPEEKVVSVTADVGPLRHSFVFDSDRFAQGDSSLDNGRTYYFMAVAYAHNNWENFDPNANGGYGEGQPQPYLEGTGNVQVYEWAPGPRSGIVTHVDAGELLPVVRLEGSGTGGFFLNLADETITDIWSGDPGGRLTYKAGAAPIEIKVVDPASIPGGRYEILLTDNDPSDPELTSPVHWKLTNVNDPDEAWVSDHPLVPGRETVIPELGISLTIGDVPDISDYPGNAPGSPPPFVGFRQSYSDPLSPNWLGSIPDRQAPWDYVRTLLGQPDAGMDPSGIFRSFGSGNWFPYPLLAIDELDNAFGGTISPVWPELGELVRSLSRGKALNNVDLVFTSDKSRWSRCVVLEASPEAFRSFGLNPEGNAAHLDLRQAPSVGKEDLDGDGLPDPDGDGIGMGWFPGYALDVETGKRLNLFFAEASVYRCDEPAFASLELCDKGYLIDPTGADMMWNPSSQIKIEDSDQFQSGLFQFISGGMHYIYVTDQEYDGCASLRQLFGSGTSIQKTRALSTVRWAGFPILEEGTNLLPYREGLIPNDVMVQVRADRAFRPAIGAGINNGYPTYQFSLEEIATPAREIRENKKDPFSTVTISPNPVLSRFGPNRSGRIRIQGIPQGSEVAVFDLNGNRIRILTDRGPVPQVEWDLADEGSNPVGPGVYLLVIRHDRYGRTVRKLIVQ